MIMNPIVILNEENTKTWNFLFSRQMTFLKGKVWKGFESNLATLGLLQDKLPNLEEVDNNLFKLSNWNVQLVDGFVNPDKYLTYLSSARFPVNPRIRPHENLDFAKEPDLFHDSFGHLHLLINKDYCTYLQGISKLALKYIEDPQRLYLLTQFNKWTTEFGLIREQGEVKIYGAGLVSSILEAEYVFSGTPKLFEADVNQMIATPHKPIELQDQYFVIDSFSWLSRSLVEIEQYLLNLSWTD